MTTAFTLIRKVLLRELPPRVALWGFLNMINRNLKTGNRRFEFERLYLENRDPWNYTTSEYEHNKYQRTLNTILKWRRGNQTVLEIGCSVGVFSKMLAPNFARCIALDISSEALRAAVNYNRSENNIRFVRDDLRVMNLGIKCDVIVCAEILYYILQKDAGRASQNLSKHLVPGGILVFISGCPSGEPNFMYFDDWQKLLSINFKSIYEEVVEDPLRPYRIQIFSRSG